jgi:hypothetical protein
LPDGQGRRRLNKIKIYFAFVFVFDKFLTLDKENMLSLFSLNRNFALRCLAAKVGGASTKSK